VGGLTIQRAGTGTAGDLRGQHAERRANIAPDDALILPHHESARM